MRTVRFAATVVVLVAAISLCAAATPAFALNGAASPAVTAIWPRSGPVRGGTSVTVVGSGFTGATAVSVAGALTNAFTVVSDTVVQVTAPPAAAGFPATGPVVVSTPTGNSAANALDTFAYRSGGTSIMVPSYIYPGAAWSQINAGHPPVDLAIINPASGPGSSPDPNYASQVLSSQSAGVDVVGYVHTSYGSRSLGTVENEISEYETWYHVNGIFVDEASTSCSTEASYYAPLYAYIHAQPGLDLTILNPGTATNQCYMAASDVILGFEGSPTDLAGAGPLPSWTATYTPGRFWGVVYGTSGAALPSVLSTLAGDGFGEVYVTDQNLPNPYGALPTYWNQEVTDAASPGSGSPPVAQTVTFTTTPPVSSPVGATYPVAAVGGPSGQPVVLSVDPSSTSVCTLAQGTVTFGAAGTCVIDANQAGTAAYAPAPQAQQVITVSSAPIAQTVTFTTTPPVSPAVGAKYSVVAVGGPSGQPVVLSVDPSSTSVCSFSRRATVTFRTAGTCVIDANQAGTAAYAPAPQAQQVIAVGSTSSPPAAQTVTFTTTPPVSPAVGATYSVVAVGGPSGQPVVLSVDPSSTSVCTLAQGTVTFGAAGTCVIDANQAGTAAYAPAPQAQQVITVSSASAGSAPTITSPSNDTVPADQSFTFTVSATGNPTPTINVSGNLPRGVSVSGGTNGTATISGTSRRSRTYTLSITATNGTGRTASQNFTLTFS